MASYPGGALDSVLRESCVRDLIPAPDTPGARARRRRGTGSDQQVFHVAINRAHERSGLLTDGARRLADRPEPATGERVAAFDATAERAAQCGVRPRRVPRSWRPSHHTRMTRWIAVLKPIANMIGSATGNIGSTLKSEGSATENRTDVPPGASERDPSPTGKMAKRSRRIGGSHDFGESCSVTETLLGSCEPQVPRARRHRGRQEAQRARAADLATGAGGCDADRCAVRYRARDQRPARLASSPVRRERSAPLVGEFETWMR